MIQRTSRPAAMLTLTLAAVLLASCGGGGEDPIPVEPDGGIGDGAGPPPGAYSDVDLDVTIDHPDIEAYTYSISCSGDDATVDGVEGIDAAEACARLSEPSVQQRLIEGPPDDRVCTEIYGGPDTATIEGTIDTSPVDTVVDRTNGCGISEWDEMLAGVLPEAIGVTE